MKKVKALAIASSILIFELLCLALPQKIQAVNIGEVFKIRTPDASGNVGPGISSLTEYDSLGTFLSTAIIPNIFVIANIIVFFFIVFGGFTIIAGSGNPEQQKKGAGAIKGALIGFVLIFTAYWLVQLVGYMLGIEDVILNPKDI